MIVFLDVKNSIFKKKKKKILSYLNNILNYKIEQRLFRLYKKKKKEKKLT